MRILWQSLCGLSVLLMGCGTNPPANQQARFECAQLAFDDAESTDEYLTVAGTYQQLIDDGLLSAAVFFNQGNAFMRADKVGRAIASYRQALRLAPSDTAIRSNLQVALAQTGGSDPPDDLFCKLIFWQEWIGYSMKFYLATTLLALTSLLLVAARIQKNRPLRTCGTVFLVGSTVAIASAVYDWNRFENRQAGVVIAETKAFKGNATNYEPAFSTTLAEGVEFTVNEQRGDWLRITIPTVGEGWVPAENIVVY